LHANAITNNYQPHRGKSGIWKSELWICNAAYGYDYDDEYTEGPDF
jgi:hypothetical protein